MASEEAVVHFLSLKTQMPVSCSCHFPHDESVSVKLHIKSVQLMQKTRCLTYQISQAKCLTLWPHNCWIWHQEWWVKDGFSGTDAFGASSVSGHLSWPIKSAFGLTHFALTCYVENRYCPSLWIEQQWLWPNKENCELSLLSSFSAFTSVWTQCPGRKKSPCSVKQWLQCFPGSLAHRGQTMSICSPRWRSPIWLLLIHNHPNSKLK